ncbi:DTW domain-containing protein [Jimgerdemannia flammicorona]|uniref:tRNA-uridine aminocarboxypropyltransferase n=1 Tax=Jimgerdemannia flammicorona TaxID=994334 RepID=A0A433BT22_9FUNG|nr:DTW domain-containing protein [Jimgerdemannia flammicorona]
MDALSDTLLHYILSFLDPASLCRSCCVSRRLRYFADSDRLWKPLCLDRFSGRHIPTNVMADEIERRTRNLQRIRERRGAGKARPEWSKMVRFQKQSFDVETTPFAFTNTYWSWKRTYLGDLKLDRLQRSGVGKGNRIDVVIAPKADDDANSLYPQSRREYCKDCWRPNKQCICDSLSPEPYCNCNVRLVVLQDPKCQVNIGTLRILKRVLKYCDIFVGKDFSRERFPDLDRILDSPTSPALLLYPSASALPLTSTTLPIPPPHGATTTACAHPTEAPHTTLVAIDGSWSQAKLIHRYNARLQELPAVMLAAPEPSVYHALKREPRRTCVSTAEAVGRAVGMLGWGDEEALMEDILRPLRRIVEMQKEYQVQGLALEASEVGRSGRSRRRAL